MKGIEMSKTLSTNDLVRNLISIKEYRVATRVLLCNTITTYLVVRGNHLKRQLNKHGMMIANHEARIDAVADDAIGTIKNHI